MKFKNISTNKHSIILFLIIITAAFLRFWQLGQTPPSLDWDEAAWGYNAYSLGLNGKDEFGIFLPHNYLESFGDFKPPMYAYLTVLPVKIFGLTEFATRFSSAFFGTFTVLITYFLVKRLFQTSEKKYLYAILAAFFLAISPWHINLSRAAFEANVATFFIICGVWLFLKGIHGKGWWFTASFISFVFSMYTFNTERIVVPLLIAGLTVGFYKILLQKKTAFITAGIIGIFILLPTIPFLVSPQAGLRFKEVNIFSDISIIQTSNQEIVNDHNSVWSKILHNRKILYSLSFMKHYLDNLNPNFLFVSGDSDTRFATQDVGQMYIFDAFFVIIGIFFIIKQKEKNLWILFYWLLIGIIPAATARETPHALRIEAAIPILQIFSAFGFSHVLLFMEKIRLKYYIKNTIFVLGFGLLFLNVLYYLHGYYIHYPKETSKDWEYGYKDSVAYVASVQNQYDQIDVSNVLGRPYIYYLFYTQGLPESFRSTARIYRDSFGFVHVLSFGKYIFEDPYNHISDDGKKVLYIGDAEKLPTNVHVKKTFYLLNGQSIFVAYTK